MKRVTKAVFSAGHPLRGLNLRSRFTLTGTRACTENSLGGIEQ